MTFETNLPVAEVTGCCDLWTHLPRQPAQTDITLLLVALLPDTSHLGLKNDVQQCHAQSGDSGSAHGHRSSRDNTGDVRGGLSDICMEGGGECCTPESLCRPVRRVDTAMWFTCSSCVVALDDVSGAPISKATAAKTYIFHWMQGNAEMAALRQDMPQMQQEQDMLQMQLEQDMLQVQQKLQSLQQDLQVVASAFGPEFICGVALELMLFAIRKEPSTAPPGNTSPFQTKARLQTQLQTFTDLLNQSGKVVIPFTPSKLAVAIDGIINWGDGSVHHSSRTLLEADIGSAKALMTRHPQLLGSVSWRLS